MSACTGSSRRLRRSKKGSGCSGWTSCTGPKGFTYSRPQQACAPRRAVMAADLFIHVRTPRPGDGVGVAINGTRHFFRGHALPRGDGVADGIFAGWTWDGSRLVVRTDRYG